MIFSLPAKRPLVMGILNVTPDSFSGDGLLSGEGFVEAALAQALQMVADGADILDVGGESTRPGATPVSAEEEIRRIFPVLKAVRAKLPDLPLSVDTMKAEVASAAIEAGAAIINDISGAAQPAAMRTLAARSGAYLVLMHNQARRDAIKQEEKIGGSYDAPDYADVVEDVRDELLSLVRKAREEGVEERQIILDPGIGFGKTAEQNRSLIKQIAKIEALGFPVLLAASRKSFIGQTLDLPPEDRLEGTAASVAVAVFGGAAIVRVHDVKFMARVARMAAALRDS